MTYTFFPPVEEEGPIGGNWLFMRYRRKQGVTVFRIDGQWYESRFPAADDLAEADRVYLGGHEYEVTAAEKNDLENAGYTVVTS